ncbi:hypothetical protein CGRA01v4_11485 [Colletotrichum graminicola]|nr:hypothetical protein CGRA01v4_11485 [Colletotrichum graminicola]
MFLFERPLPKPGRLGGSTVGCADCYARWVGWMSRDLLNRPLLLPMRDLTGSL